MKLMPFAAFVEAWFKPRIWLRIFSDTARPDASSAARVIRIPDDRCSLFLFNES
jgi:hypothetical protein